MKVLVPITLIALTATVLASLSAQAIAAPSAAAVDTAAAVSKGRYLVQTAGCNDCHTPGYVQAGGRSPEATWLTGDRLGWQGPWGTTYATNLRLFFAGVDEAGWLTHARAMEPRPPMPWFNLRAMSDDDLRAIYHYVKAAGPAGQPAPAFVPPGRQAAGPVVRFP